MKSSYIFAAYATTAITGSLIAAACHVSDLSEIIESSLILLVISAIAGLPATMILWALQYASLTTGRKKGLQPKHLFGGQMGLAVLTFAILTFSNGRLEDIVLTAAIVYPLTGALNLVLWYGWSRKWAIAN